MKRILVCVALWMMALTVCAAAEEIQLPLEVIIEESLGELEGETYSIEEERYTLPCKLSVFFENSWWLFDEKHHMFEEYMFEDEMNFEHYLEMWEAEEKCSYDYIQLMHNQYYGEEYERMREEFDAFYAKYELEEWDDSFYEMLLEGFEEYYADEYAHVFFDNYWLHDESRVMSAEELSNEENVYILRRYGDAETMVVTLRSEDGEDCVLGDFLVTSISVGNTDTIFELYQDKWAKVACAGLKYGETTWQDIPDNIDADAGFAWFEGEEDVTGRRYAIGASFLGEGETLDQMTISVQ